LALTASPHNGWIMQWKSARDYAHRDHSVALIAAIEIGINSITNWPHRPLPQHAANMCDADQSSASQNPTSMADLLNLYA